LSGLHLLPYTAAEDAANETPVAEEEELASVMVEMLSRRFRYVLDASFNAEASDAPQKMAKLDSLEKKLYEEVNINNDIDLYIVSSCLLSRVSAASVRSNAGSAG